MEKRVIAAIALSIAILFAFRYYEEKYVVKPVKPAPKAATVSTNPPVESAPVEKPAQAAAAAAALPATAPEELIPARRVVVESPLYRAVLENHGGVITGWQLQKYQTGEGKPFDMIPSAHMEGRPYPGSLVFDDKAMTAAANDDNYTVELDPPSTAPVLTAPVTVVMRLRRGDFTIEKRFQFEPANYVVNLTTTLLRSNQPVRGRMVLGQDVGPEPEHLMNPSLQLMAVYDLGGKVQRDAGPKDENEIRSISGDVRWVGIDMQYFAEIAVPVRPLPAFDFQRRPVKVRDLKGQEIDRNLIRVTVPVDGSADFRMYFGPKSQPNLAAVPGADLTGAIDYGTYLGIIVKPLLIVLRFINQYTHNYGVAIILLTFGLTLVLFPFRLKQMVSMKKMSVLQPKIKEIQERYKKYKKTDPKRAEMNQEVMALYKQHNVNPLGGCLPLVLQMPFLFAFYRLLAASIELRHAPFMGWLQDLSGKDPYYILPIVMGITMLISQKMTPMTPGTDPTQAKMMMIMPVVMTIFFLNVSSGLNLYFLCSNVFQIAFQKIAERWVGDQQSASKAKNKG
jgi:YidC/Oxa1 family membrane protein insertase